MSPAWNILFQIPTWDCPPFDSSVYWTAVSSGAFHSYPIWKYHLCPISNTAKPWRWLAVSSFLTLTDARSQAVYRLPHSARTNHCTRGLVLLQHSPGSSTAGLHTAGSSVNSSWMNGWILNEHTIYICQALSQHQDISGSDEHGIISSFKEN